MPRTHSVLTVMLVSMLTLTLAPAGGARADTIELKNGDKVTGDVVERTEERIVIDSPALGRVEIPADELKPPEEEKPGLFGTRFLAGWNRSASAGISGSEGETQDMSINANMTLDHEGELWNGIWRANYFLSREDDTTSDNKFFADALESRRLWKDSRWMITADARYDYDEKQAWRHRIAGHAGPGYQIFRRDNLSTVVRLGVGGNQTVRGEQEWQTEGQVGLVLRWDLTENQTIRMNHAYLPILDDMPEFRVISTANWTLTIPELGGLGLRFGIENEYDSTRSTDKNDLKYFGNLVYAF